MTGTWTLTCPKGGVYAGEGHYAKGKKGFNLHLRSVVKIKSPRGESCDAEESENPRTRAFLPHGLTACEKKYSSVRERLSRCIRKVEKKCCGRLAVSTSKAMYETCHCNPVAVCRATVPCP